MRCTPPLKYVYQNRELVLTDPGPAVESELSSQYVTHSDNMSMFIAPVAMLSAQIHTVIGTTGT